MPLAIGHEKFILAPIVAQKKLVVTVKLGIANFHYKCREPGSQFVLNPAWKTITKEQQELMSRMLLERISQLGIARKLQVSEDTVQRYVNAASVVEKKQVEVRKSLSFSRKLENHIAARTALCPSLEF
ncbi:hypothetical protein IQ252_27130 [Tychonema sp. LEGE 07203]|nr:hypothetical protein [Tychonema sp. LEGE 07203]MBE9097477.1 hypothetical protein [Tychonema sp. LEGE 07203]